MDQQPVSLKSRQDIEELYRILWNDRETTRLNVVSKLDSSLKASKANEAFKGLSSAIVRLKNLTHFTFKFKSSQCTRGLAQSYILESLNAQTLRYVSFISENTVNQKSFVAITNFFQNQFKRSPPALRHFYFRQSGALQHHQLNFQTIMAQMMQAIHSYKEIQFLLISFCDFFIELRQVSQIECKITFQITDGWLLDMNQYSILQQKQKFLHQQIELLSEHDQITEFFFTSFQEPRPGSNSIRLQKDYNQRSSDLLDTMLDYIQENQQLQLVVIDITLSKNCQQKKRIFNLHFTHLNAIQFNFRSQKGLTHFYYSKQDKMLTIDIKTDFDYYFPSLSNFFQENCNHLKQIMLRFSQRSKSLIQDLQTLLQFVYTQLSNPQNKFLVNCVYVSIRMQQNYFDFIKNQELDRVKNYFSVQFSQTGTVLLFQFIDWHGQRIQFDHSSLAYLSMMQCEAIEQSKQQLYQLKNQPLIARKFRHEILQEIVKECQGLEGYSDSQTTNVQRQDSQQQRENFMEKIRYQVLNQNYLKREKLFFTHRNYWVNQSLQEQNDEGEYEQDIVQEWEMSNHTVSENEDNLIALSDENSLTIAHQNSDSEEIAIMDVKEHCKQLEERARETDEQYYQDSFLDDGEIEYEDDNLPDEESISADDSNQIRSQKGTLKRKMIIEDDDEEEEKSSEEEQEFIEQKCHNQVIKPTNQLYKQQKQQFVQNRSNRMKIRDDDEEEFIGKENDEENEKSSEEQECLEEKCHKQVIKPIPKASKQYKQQFVQNRSNKMKIRDDDDDDDEKFIGQKSGEDKQKSSEEEEFVEEKCHNQVIKPTPQFSKQHKQQFVQNGSNKMEIEHDDEQEFILWQNNRESNSQKGTKLYKKRNQQISMVDGCDLISTLNKNSTKKVIKDDDAEQNNSEENYHNGRSSQFKFTRIQNCRKKMKIQDDEDQELIVKPQVKQTQEATKSLDKQTSETANDNQNQGQFYLQKRKMIIEDDEDQLSKNFQNMCHQEEDGENEWQSQENGRNDLFYQNQKAPKIQICQNRVSKMKIQDDNEELIFVDQYKCEQLEQNSKSLRKYQQQIAYEQDALPTVQPQNQQLQQQSLQSIKAARKQHLQIAADDDENQPSNQNNIQQQQIVQQNRITRQKQKKVIQKQTKLESFYQKVQIKTVQQKNNNLQLQNNGRY